MSFANLARRHWVKIVLLVALPIVLYCVLAERMSWQPKVVRVAGTRSNVSTLAWSPDSKTLAVATEDHIQIVDAKTKSVLRRMIWHNPLINSSQRQIAFSPDGAKIAAGMTTPDLYLEQPDIQVWDASDGRWLKQFNGVAPFYFNDSTISGWQFFVKSGQSQAQLVTWSVATGKQVRSTTLKVPLSNPLHAMITKLEPPTLRWSHNGRWVAAIFLILRGEDKATFHYEDLGLQLFDAKTGWLRRELVPMSSSLEVSSPAFSSDDRYMAVVTSNTGGSGYTIRILQVADGKEVEQLNVDHLPVLNALEFSPEGTQLAVTDTESNNILLWDLRTRKIARTLPHKRYGTLAFAPDSRTLAAASGTGITLWRIK